MALAPGTTLGSYEIVDSIGAGGMGEVYRARDTKLGRDVAIKVLPESFAKDSDRLARFEYEGDVVAFGEKLLTQGGVHDGFEDRRWRFVPADE